MTVGEPLLQAARDESHEAIDMIMLFGHAYASQLGGNPVAGISILNTNMRLLERSLCTTLFADLNACNEYTTGLDAAAQITQPVHLVLGEEDRMTPPASAAELVTALANCSVTILPETGHMMVTERPEPVHRELVRFLVTET